MIIPSGTRRLSGINSFRAGTFSYTDVFDGFVGFNLSRIFSSSTTAAASLLRPEDILTIARELVGAKRYALQRFQPGQTLEAMFAEEKTFSDEEFVQIKNQLAGSIPLVIVR